MTTIIPNLHWGHMIRLPPPDGQQPRADDGLMQALIKMGYAEIFGQDPNPTEIAAKIEAEEDARGLRAEAGYSAPPLIMLGTKELDKIGPTTVMVDLFLLSTAGMDLLFWQIRFNRPGLHLANPASMLCTFTSADQVKHLVSIMRDLLAP